MSKIGINFNLCKAKGFVKAWHITNGKKEIIYDDHNTILPAAKEILAHLLGGDFAVVVDTISVEASAVILASDSLLSVSYPAADAVEFTAKFNEASFAGTFDTLNLESATLGPFATLTGLALSKTNLQQLGISWTITFKDCA